MQMVDSSRARDEPVTLELGVSEIVSNPLLSAMEQAVRSHGVGAAHRALLSIVQCCDLSQRHHEHCRHLSPPLGRVWILNTVSCSLVPRYAVC